MDLLIDAKLQTAEQTLSSENPGMSSAPELIRGTCAWPK